MAGIKGKVDMKGLQKFQQQMKQLNKTQTAQFTEAAVKELAARILKRIIKRTPVDSGHLRRAWTIGEVTNNGGVYEVEIINPTEYAPYVEYGHRTPNHTGWVDGRFMLTISEQELQRDAPQILMNKMNKFFGGIFK